MKYKILEKPNCEDAYELIEEIGKDHERIFVVCVKYKGNVVGNGRGSSKKEAEQEAAKSALSKLAKF